MKYLIPFAILVIIASVCAFVWLFAEIQEETSRTHHTPVQSYQLRYIR